MIRNIWEMIGKWLEGDSEDWFFILSPVSQWFGVKYFVQEKLVWEDTMFQIISNKFLSGEMLRMTMGSSRVKQRTNDSIYKHTFHFGVFSPLRFFWVNT